ncbi:MAG: elongation factor 4, partial [Clostridia bacterium]|nr:elongation factor 4 [Clostridia bacterium]
MGSSRFRNFCIIAHIDHGKSTLADRMIEATNTVSQRDMHEQILDTMELEQERGITIKSQAVRMIYEYEGEEYTLNLIDTPGHVDFTYEVSRSMAACEGAILVVDASQGIEAQTLANVYLAMDNDLEIIPVINKIDLNSARPDEICQEIEDVLGLDTSEAPRISAKEGIGIEDVLQAVIKHLPPPKETEDDTLKALIFDSYYDNYKGAISYVRVVQGSVKQGDMISFMATNHQFEVTEVGVFLPSQLPVKSLSAGEVGYIAASIKNVSDTRVGDTITSAEHGATEPLPGYKDVTPMVFCGIYPADGADYEDLRDALAKLELNDASLIYEPESSIALGFGFRCGFLGLLHMEIIQERVEREYDLDLITTAPSVSYHVTTVKGEKLVVENPTNLPPVTSIDYMEEPIVETTIMTPDEYVGAVMDLCQEKRGTFKNMEYIEETRVLIHYIMPLNEIIYDFFDTLKSRTRGYASLDY